MDPLVRRVLARVQRFDLAWVEGLRKDFLTLLKNLPRVHDYKMAHQLDAAFRIYRKRFNEQFFEHFLDHDLKYNLGLSESDAKWYDKKIRAIAWSFSTELRLPIGFADEYHSEAEKFSSFQHEFPAWKARVQKKAQAFWKEMKDMIGYFEDNRNQPIDVKLPDIENTTIEGFKLVMRGFDPNDEYNVKELAIIKEGLKLYRQRAAVVAPILLKQQLPVIIEFASTLDKGGEYMGDGTIMLFASASLNRGPKWVAHTMAHEMGHHLFKSALSEEARKFWYATIRGDFGDLDLKELLDKWPEGAWAFDMLEKMPNDPILALQVDAVSHDHSYGEPQTKEDFQGLYDRGMKTIRVPQHPVTGYGNKNPEEAFCETIGLLVAYGPRAVHERVRWWLDTALPGAVKVAYSYSRQSPNGSSSVISRS